MIHVREKNPDAGQILMTKKNREAEALIRMTKKNRLEIRAMEKSPAMTAEKSRFMAIPAIRQRAVLFLLQA